jgi:predicted ATPase
MLTRIDIGNFLSWVDAQVDIKPLNLILGENNAGKSNLCNALRFLSLSANHPLDVCADMLRIPRTLVGNVQNNSTKLHLRICATLSMAEVGNVEYDYALDLRLPPKKAPEPHIEIELEVLLASWDGWRSVPLLTKTREKVSLLHEERLAKGKDREFVETTSPNDVSMLSRLYELNTNRLANNFKKYIQSWQFYDLSHYGLREPAYKPNDTVLNVDGSNLASVISNLKKRNEGAYRRLVISLQALEPDLEFINFSGGDTEPNVFMYFDHKSGANLPGWTASSGTLRFLALAYVLTEQPILDFKPLAMIEEPENGIYVGHLKRLLRMAESNECRTQTILTSHSPYLIDLFDDKLDSVFITRSQSHRSEIRLIDASQARKLLETMSLGEQHFFSSLK